MIVCCIFSNDHQQKRTTEMGETLQNWLHPNSITQALCYVEKQVHKQSYYPAKKDVLLATKAQTLMMGSDGITENEK